MAVTGALAMLAAGASPASAQPRPADPATTTGTVKRAHPPQPGTDTKDGRLPSRDHVLPPVNYTPQTGWSPLNFSYTATSNYWSVVAIRPPTNGDEDLEVWDDHAQTVHLATSNFGSYAVDFIAVDSNLRPVGDDYYARVSHWTGAAGPYQIELAQGSDILSPGTSTVSMGYGNVVAVRDIYLTAGTPVTLRAQPTNTGQVVELFLMGADRTNPATWVRPRNSAAASAGSAGPGYPAAFTYSPTTSGWYGVVVINRAGSGYYRLTRG